MTLDCKEKNKRQQNKQKQKVSAEHTGHRNIYNTEGTGPFFISSIFIASKKY